MSRFIMVTTRFHCGHRGTEVEDVGTNRTTALTRQIEAQQRIGMQHVGGHVELIEVGTNEQVLTPRKLTIAERLTGWTSFPC